MFGKNIKKIRSVKGMSQQEFAELFDLKRGTLGAYEEERSNPKIDTVLKIANHFSISLGDLLTKELTVNKLLKFNEAITTASKIKKERETYAIPCITEALKFDFIQNYTSDYKLDDYPEIRLPYIDHKEAIAYTIDNLEMSNNSFGYFPKDIVIGIKTELETLKDASQNNLALILTKDQLLFRSLVFNSENIILKAAHLGVEDIPIPTTEIRAVWKVIHAFHYTITLQNNLIEQRIALLEAEISSLKA